jgi:glycerol-3-phosphate dehydrogenase
MRSLSAANFRAYSSNARTGVEVGGATKNVLGSAPAARTASATAQTRASR